jgi:Protein of unknown function (DUF1579)
MNRFGSMGIVVAVLAVASQSRAAEVPEFPQPQKEHQWLQQLVGEWEADVEMFMEPGQPPVKSSATESVRAVGGFWIVAESHGNMMGHPFTGLMTLGYDVETAQYVGTWVDSMNGYLWKYEGTRDPTGKVLTLRAEGPCPMAPGELSQFKEVLELKSPDHKVFSSSIQGKDGKWTKVMTINYRRTK